LGIIKTHTQVFSHNTSVNTYIVIIYVTSAWVYIIPSLWAEPCYNQSNNEGSHTVYICLIPTKTEINNNILLIFSQYLKWRACYWPEDPLKWKAPEVLCKFYPGGYYGEDKEGFPLFFDVLGTMDLKGSLVCNLVSGSVFPWLYR
jgi:hypothetical protein